MSDPDQSQPVANLDPHRLVTLTEAAGLTGLSSEAIRLRIKRGSLQATRGNDGRHLVRVSDLSDLPPSRDQSRQPPSNQTRPDATTHDWPLGDQSSRLTDQLAEVLAKLEALRSEDRQRAETAEAEAKRLVEDVAQLRERLAKVDAEKVAAMDARQVAEAARERAEAELREARLPWPDRLARVVQAFRRRG